MLRLYLDEDVHEDIAMALRLRGYDAITTREAGNKGRADRDQLEYSTAEGRVLVSFNVADFNKLSTEFNKHGKEHGGVILSQQFPIGTIIKALLKLLADIGPGKINNRVVWLSDWIR